MAALKPHGAVIDPRSGFDKLNSTFHSKRCPIPLPPNPSLDITTFISSLPHRGSTAYIDASSGRHLSFLELWRGVDSLSSALSSMGISKGDVILILSPNSILFPLVCLSVMSLGAIITTTNPLNTAAEISKQVSDSGPILAFTTRDLVPKLADLDLPIVLIDGGDAAVAGKVRIVGELEKMLRTAPSEKRVKERVNQDDTATLLYSSGTTGVSKGVVSSHRNLIAMAQTIIGRFQNMEGMSFVCTVPMFHIYGLSCFAVAAPGNNSTVIVLSKFSAHDMLSSIEKYRATYLPLVPPIMVDMVNGADQIRAKYDLSSLQWVICGGAPLSKEVIEGFTEKYPSVVILQGYGLTESTGIGATTDNLEESRRYGTAGLLTGSMEAKVVDPVSGAAMAVNQKGELWLRGPCIMKGYFSNTEATAATLDSEGWLRTGDLCYIDEDGFIFVVDRLKELIKYKGYQVAPAELEALLLSHPEIADAAVIPFPDTKVGQYPMAYVVRKEGSDLSGSAIMEFIAKQVAPYKKVRRVAFIASVPKNPSGKILRKRSHTANNIKTVDIYRHVPISQIRKAPSKKTRFCEK